MRMVKAARRDAWDHTANLLALIINVNRDPQKGQPATAEQLHPYLEKLEALGVEQQSAAVKEQFAIMGARAFKHATIKPFTPANAEKIRNGQRRSD